MILRNLAIAIREQNWVSVGVEFTIVVAGIFVALQVNDWNQRRIDRADEQEFLSSLHDELVESSEFRRFIVEGHFVNHANLRTMLPKVFDGVGESLTAEECYAALGTQVKPNYVLDLPTLDTLLANGRLSIFSDNALQAALIHYRQRIEALERLVEPQPILLTTTHSHLFEIRAYYDAVNDDINAEESCKLQEMRNSETFRAALAYNADTYDSYFTSGLKPMIETVDELHAILDANLGIAHTGDARIEPEGS